MDAVLHWPQPLAVEPLHISPLRQRVSVVALVVLAHAGLGLAWMLHPRQTNSTPRVVAVSRENARIDDEVLG
jgi:hypothetical protein